MNRLSSMGLSVCLLTLVLVCGCQILGFGPYDEELINSTMADWKAAIIAQDLDQIMATYSENYVSTRGDGKESVREFMQRALERGYMDNAKVNLEGAETAIEGDKAEFGPVELISNRGTFTLEYTLQKENRTWLIVVSKRLEQ